MGSVMEHAYWLRRHREELALARCTTCVEAKLIHLDLAGRYSVKAREEALGLATAKTHPVYEPELLANVVRMSGTAAPSLLPFAH